MTTTVLIHDCENPLAKSELFRVRRNTRDAHRDGVRHPDIVGAHLRLETPPLHAIDDIIARGHLRRRSGHVRLTRQLARVSRRAVRRWTRDGVALGLALSRHVSSGEPDDRLLRRHRESRGCEREERDG